MIAVDEREQTCPADELDLFPCLGVPWFVFSLGGVMKQINAHFFYYLGSVIHPVAYLPGNYPAGLAAPIFANAVEALEVLVNGISGIQAPQSEEAAALLLDEIKKHLPLTAPVTGDARTRIVGLARNFAAVVSNEIQKLPIFFVAPKGLYRTSDLIEHSEQLLPVKLRDALPPQAEYDLKQAGRCLAFEAPTAVGYHLMRATEAVILKYYERLAKMPWPHPQRDWGRYITELKALGAPSKVTDALDQTRKNHRNPLLHPEDNLDLDEAIGLFGVVQGVLSLLLQEIV